MADREKILRYFRSSGDGELASRLLDLVEFSVRYNRYKVSEFLDPHGLNIAETIAANYAGIEIIGNGGYSGAERVKAAFVDKEFPGTIDYGLSALSISWDSRYYHITHRDVLGAILASGVKREVIGDIVMSSDGCIVITDNSLKQYILQNTVKIGAAPTSISEIALDEIPAREERVKEIRTTVPSLRLDVIAASGFGVSRSKMADEISFEKVKVNWQNAKNSAQSIKVGDIISMRGRGRVEVCEIVGQTKKARTSIILKRFI